MRAQLLAIVLPVLAALGCDANRGTRDATDFEIHIDIGARNDTSHASDGSDAALSDSYRAPDARVESDASAPPAPDAALEASHDVASDTQAMDVLSGIDAPVDSQTPVDSTVDSPMSPDAHVADATVDITEPDVGPPCKVGAPCDDGNLCTHSDALDGSCTCVGVGYTCKIAKCAGKQCDGDGGCIAPLVIAAGYCYIDGDCVADLSTSPHNWCQYCNSVKSATSWQLYSLQLGDGRPCGMCTAFEKCFTNGCRCLCEPSKPSSCQGISGTSCTGVYGSMSYCK